MKMELTYILIFLLGIILVLWLQLIIQLKDMPVVFEIVGEILFAVGIALMVGTIFKYDVILETKLFTIFMLVGALSVFFGAIIKIIAKN